MKRTSIRATWTHVLAALAVCAALGWPAYAVVTATWEVDSYRDFDKGEAKASFITSLGEVKPGWATRRTHLELDGVWAMVRAGDGTLLLGTDDKGTIYAVRGEKVSPVVSIEDAIAVVSLAIGDDGALYAGTMPGGQVWKVDVAAGKASRLAELPDVETVWALALAAGGDALYAGTGPEGKLFRIDAKTGRHSVAFDADDKRILSLVATRDGAIWMGTSDRALVYRHDPATRRTRAMADFAGNEITALAELGGGVVVAANEFAEPTTTGVKTRAAVEKAAKQPTEGHKPKMPAADSAPGADKPAPAGSEPPRRGERKGKGALFRLHGDGRLQQLHALTATYFSALAVTDDGAIFAGAGDQGRIYLIGTDESVSTAIDVDERMIAAMAWDATGGLTFTTGDAAAFYRTAGDADASSYRSEVFDAKVPSRFGRIAWHGTGAMKVETRSGNTARPGPGWSEWSAPTGIAPGGGNSRSGLITSPPGRYLQYRVSFGGDAGALLRKTTVFYLPQNEPTRITEVTIDAGGRGKRLVTVRSGATTPRSPIIKLAWKVENPDDDETVYTLAVRREGEVTWRPLPTGPGALTKTSFDWNTETFPDGYYRLRVSSNDRRANSADRARKDHHITPLFLVDNERPRIDAVNVRYPRASARATDAMSTIAEMAYSVNDGPWRVGTTADGIFDELSEVLVIDLPDDLDSGIHTLSIRVADAAGNIASTSVTFRVP